MKRRIIAAVMTLCLTAGCAGMAFADEAPVIDIPETEISSETEILPDDPAAQGEEQIPESDPGIAVEEISDVPVSEAEPDAGETSISEDPSEASDISEIQDAEDALLLAASHQDVQTALNIPVNSYFTDSVSKYGAENWYKITLNKPGYIDFSFSHDFVDENDDYWRLYLYSPDDLNSEMLMRKYIGNEMNEVKSYGTGLPAGTYYIMITDGDFDHSSLPYRFKVNYTESNNYEKEWNNTAVSASAISLNTYYNGNIMKTSEEDWYSFTLTSPGYISTSFLHDFVDENDDYWRLYFYSKNDLNSPIFDRYYIGNEMNEDNEPGTGLPAGTYYVKITDGDFDTTQKSYRFCIHYTASSAWEMEVNDSSSSANTISLDKYYNGNITEDRDEDWFTFTINSGQNCSIAFSHGFVDENDDYWRLYLYSKDNINSSILDVDYYGNRTGESTNYIYLSPGVYYIRVISGNFDYSYLPYKLKVGAVKYDQYLTLTGKKTLTAGKKAKISVSGAYGALSFKSNKPSVVTVNSSTGAIKAKSAGTATITVTAAETANYYKGVKKITIKVIPAATAIQSLKKKGKGFTVKWKKVSGITGYQIQYSTKINFSSKKTVTVKKPSATSKTVSGLKKGKRYYVRIRTYKKVNGKTYYSGWCTKNYVRI